MRVIDLCGMRGERTTRSFGLVSSPPQRPPTVEPCSGSGGGSRNQIESRLTGVRGQGTTRRGFDVYDHSDGSPNGPNRAAVPGDPCPSGWWAKGAPEAFLRLEERMQSLQGYKMYGLLYPGQPTAYYACLRLDDDHCEDLGFERAEVPGGLYGRRLVRNWENKISKLSELFDQLQADLFDAGFLGDATRPLLEFYRRSDELLMMVPVFAGPEGQPNREGG